jgi:hypothetical protein
MGGSKDSLRQDGFRRVAAAWVDPWYPPAEAQR